jgi:SET domain-containing protein
MITNNKIYVNKSPKGGLGVFAAKDITPGQTVEVCPCLPRPNGSWGTAVNDYLFSRGKLSSLALGYGSIYNHSQTPNARQELTKGLKTMNVIATKPIKKNEEIFITYGPDYWETRPTLKLL